MLRTILLVTVLGGCSIAMQRKPGDGAVKSADCSTSAVYPAIDMIAVGASVAAIVAGVIKADDWGDGGATLSGAGAIGGIVFTASGVEGIRARRACQAQRHEPSSVASK